MAENSANFNIFKGAPASFRDALPLFAGVTGTVLPVHPEAAGPAQLYTLSPASEGGQSALPAFTSEELLEPPFIRRSLADTAALFFHAPGHEVFIFNPRHPQARSETAPLKTSRRDVSLLAGFIRTAGENLQEDPGRLAAGEFALGNLHAAHYLYAMTAARNPASRARFQLGAVLVELGLLQEAYDSLKNDTDPEALLCLAVIHRKSGNTALARKTLSSLPQGAQEERREIETAWLDLEEGKEEEAQKTFQRLSSSADKVEALSGLGAAMAKTAFKTKDKRRLAAAATALRSALAASSPASARIFFQLGNLYFRSGEAAQAEVCYRLSAALAPAVQTLANLALTLIKTGKQAEAAAITAQVALTDIASARRLAAGFPKDSQAGLFQPVAQEPRSAPQPAPAAQIEPAPIPVPIPAPAIESPSAPQPAAQSVPAQGTAGGSLQFINPSAKTSPAQPSEANPLSPAQPQAPSISGRQPGTAGPAPAQQIQAETMRGVTSSAPQPAGEEIRDDDFISRAFKLASSLEDKLGRKIYFNLEGLSEVERSLRLKFVKARANPQGNLETIRDCAAFLCYFLREKHNGRLIKPAGSDPWSWPMVFEQPGFKVTTYPVERVWRLLWKEAVPESGWLTKYSHWLAARLKETVPPACGAAAAGAKIMSHPERLIDAQTEHKRMLMLIAGLSETAHIEIGRAGLVKLESAVKNNFRPGAPPTADGWKLLRCYGHVLAAILARDFKAVWYNTDGDDGGWSMQLPWETLVFPLGKIYKAASLREDLGAYYEALLGEKLRSQSGPTV